MHASDAIILSTVNIDLFDMFFFVPVLVRIYTRAHPPVTNIRELLVIAYNVAKIKKHISNVVICICML
jgi:hypothetical protein